MHNHSKEVIKKFVKFERLIQDKNSTQSVDYALFLLSIKSYFTSSKTTLTDYQCVSTGCCTHVAKTEITIDNQHVTKSMQRYIILPKQPKENTEKS